MNYGNYSRRGLIKMNGEFDEANDRALSNFVEGREYESVRTVEQMIEAADKVGASVSNASGKAAKAIASKLESQMESLLEEISTELAQSSVASDAEVAEG